MLPLFALVNLLSALGALSAATPSRPKISCSSYVGLDADLFTPSRNGSSQTLGYKRITLDDGTRASAMARLPHNQTGYAHIKAHECNGQYYTSGFESGVNILQARTLDDTHCITVLSVGGKQRLVKRPCLYTDTPKVLTQTFQLATSTQNEGYSAVFGPDVLTVLCPSADDGPKQFLTLGGFFSPAPYFNPRACGLLFANATGDDYGTDG